ncbi:MAG: hypothetical protein HY397_02495 [Candidatus Doudnabacteria bacterium]|nr:hypothetical protein [Candidatus Doudnabacteria bacterium]
MKDLKEQIEAIVRDLYAADPGLMAHDRIVRQVVAELLSAKPQAILDEGFQSRLRTSLLSRISARSESQTGLERLFILFRARKLNLVLTSALTLLLVIAGAWYFSSNSGQLRLAEQRTGESSRTKIVKLADRAFGKLAVSDQGRGGGGTSGPVVEEKMDAGLESPLALESAQVARPQSGGGAGVGSEIVVYQPFRFVYRGEEVTLDKKEVSVLKKQPFGQDSFLLGSILSALRFVPFDLASFSFDRLQYVSLAQDQEFGYVVSVDFENGAVYISPNWNKWLAAQPQCQDQECFERKRIRVDQIPDDETLIRTTDEFLAQYGIGRSAFGQPKVQNQWRIDYEKSLDKQAWYLPEVISVVYPEMIDGQEVYDEGGNLSGLWVNVNVRVKKVSELYGLTSQNYQSSLYEAETDFSRIVSIAENGGFRGGFAGDPGGRTEVELETPVEKLVKIWNWQDGKSEELLVPALVFPVKPKEFRDYYLPPYVVVPLVSDLLENVNDGPVKIMR